MKRNIQQILCAGFTLSKKYSMEDYIKYLYPLKYILQHSADGLIRGNNNDFWDSSNNQRRIELLHDIASMRTAKTTDDSYFRIINRFENGDKYGIIINA